MYKNICGEVCEGKRQRVLLLGNDGSDVQRGRDLSKEEIKVD
jgi:hypothetical protein